MSNADSRPWRRRLLEALKIEDFATRQLFVLGVVAAAAAERKIDLVLVGAAAHWKSQSDREWATRLLALHAPSIDWPYLEQQALAEGMGELLNEVRQQSRQWRGEEPSGP